MLPIIHIVLPMYAVCCALGVIAAAILLISRVKKYGVPPIHAIQVCIFAAIGTVIGSKLLFLLTQLDTIIPEFSFGLLIGRFINSGFVFYGGLFGALAGVKIYSAVRKYDSLIAHLLS
jgi:prolipoprotein diacylglyceryl transferase 1